MSHFFSSYGDLLIIVATVVGFFMAWGIYRCQRRRQRDGNLCWNIQ
ncbi:MAG: hypothetical protein MJK10_21700 [Pseudomonadales bacterium]|nr:hypothetical protein [Pseudomonadales bacterium]NRA15433.1 hypothetical protein [Oceanospirillaceae bacterium]